MTDAEIRAEIIKEHNEFLTSAKDYEGPIYIWLEHGKWIVEQLKKAERLEREIARFQQELELSQ